jgi:FKBP-type peptidyl-prolyl cis-trans isomerase
MKIKGLVVVVSVIALVFGSCGKNSVKNAKIRTKEDSLSYAFGIVNYNGLIADSLSLNPIVVARAMHDGSKGTPLMTDELARGFIMMYINDRETERTEKQAEMNKITYKDHIIENEAFLAKNKERPGVTVTSSGLQYEVIQMGTGPMPTINNTVKVHYVGTLIDGTEFDSSVKRNEPAQFQLSEVISGWTEALQLMPVGSKFKVFLPESIAYGSGGIGGVIKPYSTLIFEIELLDIVQ